ncbi:hypothetical protein D3OALGA1CA_4451 [Olavius algarvensis associated proteobacterium Delta 3]|nr:hypothetical protein D3OALGA1CA_4451 [Olavius algarvensis associated proteobacterium Delta 3]
MFHQALRMIRFNGTETSPQKSYLPTGFFQPWRYPLNDVNFRI